MNERKERQATGLQLSKNSTPETIKTYFEKVFELNRSGEKFPVNLDAVWLLIYSRSDRALAALTSNSNFIDGYDYNLLQMGKVVRNSELRNGIKVDITMTVPCMEFFIAKKVRSVFEVYRQKNYVL